MLGLSLRARSDTNQVMLGVSVQATRHTTQVMLGVVTAGQVPHNSSNVGGCHCGPGATQLK